MIRKVLILDDEPEAEAIAHVKHFLRQKPWHYEVFTVTHSREFFAKLRANQYSVSFVMIDLHLGIHETGLQVLQELRKGDLIRPAIILTISKDSEDIKDCMEAGAFDYINKDQTPDLMTLRLEIALRRLQQMEPPALNDEGSVV